MYQPCRFAWLGYKRSECPTGGCELYSHFGGRQTWMVDQFQFGNQWTKVKSDRSISYSLFQSYGRTLLHFLGVHAAFSSFDTPRVNVCNIEFDHSGARVLLGKAGVHWDKMVGCCIRIDFFGPTAMAFGKRILSSPRLRIGSQSSWQISLGSFT